MNSAHMGTGGRGISFLGQYGAIDERLPPSGRLSRLSRVLAGSGALVLAICCLAALRPSGQEEVAEGLFEGQSGVVSMAIEALKLKTMRGRQPVQTSLLDEADVKGFPEDVQSALNTSVSPCDDFYEFTCGTWDAETTIPDYQSAWAKQWDGVTIAVENDTVTALEKDKGVAGRFYRSCMDTDQIEQLGGKPLAPWLKTVDEIVDHKTLTEKLIVFAIADMNLFWSWWVDSDNLDASFHSFFISQGGISMPDRSYYLDQTTEMEGHRKAYKSLIVNLMQLAGRTHSQAVEDADNTMDLETALAKALTPNAEERQQHGYRASIEDLSSIAPDIDWKAWFNGIGIKKMDSPATGYLVLRNKDFLRQMSTIMRTIGLEKIKSYMRWQAIYSYAPMLDMRFEQNLLTYNKELYGIQHLPPRYKKCFFSVSGSLSMPTGKLFVETAFPESARKAAIDMLEQIRDRFNATLQVKSWMDPVTREKAVGKLAEMFLEVGHPSVWPKSTFDTLDEYGGIHEGKFFENNVVTNSREVKVTLARMGKPVDRKRWGSLSVTAVNSFYNRQVNGIFIPAGILQPPFYDEHQAVARNYGSVGAICGHEMTHGFDDVGREYDAMGNRHPWWKPQVVTAFKERAKCISDLFSSYVNYGGHVNGELVLGEAIADR